jgi:LuxR family maltose regulon positive regulatory protein
LTWAEWLITNASPEMRKGALPFIEDAIVRMDRHHNLRLATVFSVLRAMALDAEGRRDDALVALAETLHRAAPHGLVRTFVDRGTRLHDLLDELSRREGSAPYRDMLRAVFLEERTSVGRKAVIGAQNPGQLSYRELDVLELLVEGLSNKDIAARLSLSTEAIKKRARNIYRKLGVADRRAAVNVALTRAILRKRY